MFLKCSEASKQYILVMLINCLVLRQKQNIKCNKSPSLSYGRRCGQGTRQQSQYLQLDSHINQPETIGNPHPGCFLVAWCLPSPFPTHIHGNNIIVGRQSSTYFPTARHAQQPSNTHNAMSPVLSPFLAGISSAALAEAALRHPRAASAIGHYREWPCKCWQAHGDPPEQLSLCRVLEGVEWGGCG